MSLTKALKIREHIEDALKMIEFAIREDPNHVDCYIKLKDQLIDADNTISFCIND
jgi:hypothetical protein